MPDEELLRTATDMLLECERTGDFRPLLAQQARLTAGRLLCDAAPAPAEPVQFHPVFLACMIYWYRAMAGELNPEAEQDGQAALALRNILRHHLPDPSVLPGLPPGVPETDVDRLTLRVAFAFLVGAACHTLSAAEESGGARDRAQALLDQGIGWLADVLAALPAEHASRADVAVMLAALRMQRYQLGGDKASLAAVAETVAQVAPEKAAPLRAALRLLDLEERIGNADALPAAVRELDEVADLLSPEAAAPLQAALRLLDVEERIGNADALPANIRDLGEVVDLLGQDRKLGTDQDVMGAIGQVLTALTADRGFVRADNETLTRLADLLRRTADGAEPGGPLAARLGEVLTVLGAYTSDPGVLIEAGAAYGDPDQADVPVQESPVKENPGPESEGPVRESTGSDANALAAFRSAWARLLQAQLSYIHTHDPGQLEFAKRGIPPLLDLAQRADAGRGDGKRDCEYAVVILRDQLELRGPGGATNPDITDEIVEQCRRTRASIPEGRHREQADLTLQGALMARATAIRDSDPERARQLLTEAAELAGHASGFAGVLGPLIRRLLAIRGGEPEPQADPQAEPTRLTLPPELAALADNPLVKTVVELSQRASTRQNPMAELRQSVDLLRNPALPAWYRAQLGFIAASEAALMTPNGLGWSIGFCAEALLLVEKLTDRGSSEAAAENALIAFDGTVRQLAALMSANALLPGAQAVTEELKRQGTRLQALVDAGVPGSEPSAELIRTVAGMTSLTRNFRLVSGPEVDAIVALHERGRGLLLARRLESRIDHGRLRSDHPELAARFDTLTARLEAGTGRAPAAERLDGLRTSQELDEVIALIRRQPGFEDFLTWFSPGNLRDLAANGPVVVFNHAAKFFCTAFLVTQEKITALMLTVTAEEVTDASQRLGRAIEAIYARGASRPPLEKLLAARDEITAILAWTWHKIVAPVLEPLGFGEPGTGAVGTGAAERPRIWWIPTGPFNGLPLHAAQCTGAQGDGCDAGGCGSALDRAVSSFIPGFQTLAHARARLARSPAGTGDGTRGRALVVAESEDVLPGVAAASRFAAGELDPAELLTGPDATRSAVVAALGNSPWVQFGCHAHSSPDRPAGSWVQLPSGEALTVADIYRTRPDSARLAVLTACGTARTSERLPDEAVHITSAFLLAGYPEAVGTLWEVDSARIESFLRGFYPRALAGALTPARAVHDAVRELRDQFPDRPHVWAAYIHAGA